MAYEKLGNRAMARKLASGEALDMQDVSTGFQRDVYQLVKFVDGVDYCDSSREAWIWSIGRRHSDGTIWAALDTRFYQHPDYECLWLR